MIILRYTANITECGSQLTLRYPLDFPFACDADRTSRVAIE